MSDDLSEILHNKEFDLIERIGQVVEFGHVNEIVEVGAREPAEKVLLAVVNDQQALQVVGGRDHVEHVGVRVEARMRRVDDLDDFLEAARAHALQLDRALARLAHSASEHRPEVVAHRCQYDLVYVEVLV